MTWNPAAPTGHNVELTRQAGADRCPRRWPTPEAAEQTVRRYEELELGLHLAAAGA